MCRTTGRWLGLLGVLWGMGVLASPLAAQSQPATQPSPPRLSSYLGRTYRDSTYGFELRPFSSLSEAKHAGGEDVDQVLVERSKQTSLVTDSTVLVRFTWPERGWTLNVEQHLAKPETTTQDLVADLISLTSDEKGRVRFFERDISRRKSVGAVYVGSDEERRAVRQTAAVRIRPGEFFVLRFESPHELQAQAEHDFGPILDSFSIFDSDVTREMMAKAVEQGANLVSKARNTRLEQLLFPETWYAIQMPIASRNDPKITTQQTVGFLRVIERRGEHVVARRADGRTGETIPGVILEERGRIYQSDGTVVTLRKDFFISSDGDLTTSTVYGGASKPITSEDGTPQYGPDGKPLYNRQFTTCSTLRQDKTLLVSFSEEFSDLAKKNLAIPVDESFFDPIMERIVPRLMDLKKPRQLFAFSVFNQDREGLGLNTVQVVGPQPMEVDGKMEPTVLLESREGLDAPPSRMWVDAKGQMVKSQSGDLVLIRAPKAVLQAKYDEARAADAPIAPGPKTTITPRGGKK